LKALSKESRVIAPPSPNTIHTIGLFVRDKPGVLVRVALVFARRGYNIESLVVSPSAHEGFSRMTITSTGDVETLEQIIKQLDKLVDVVSVYDHTGTLAIQSEIALIKIQCPLNQRTEVLQIAEHYHAKVVDYQRESLILQVAGSTEKLDCFVDLLTQFEVLELVRSGKLVMARGTTPTAAVT